MVKTSTAQQLTVQMSLLQVHQLAAAARQCGENILTKASTLFGVLVQICYAILVLFAGHRSISFFKDFLRLSEGLVHFCSGKRLCQNKIFHCQLKVPIIALQKTVNECL